MVPWTPFVGVVPDESPNPLVQKAMGKYRAVWRNSRYQVIEYPPETVAGVGRVVWLSLRAIDRSARHDWREMQRLKNEIVGPEYDAVEIYPAESKLVDNANQYHLWVFLDSRIPFGFHHRIVSDGKFEKSVQRPFEVRPADCGSSEEVAALTSGTSDPSLSSK